MSTKVYLAFVESYRRELTIETANETGQMLKDANIASLNARYPDLVESEDQEMYDTEPFKFQFSFITMMDPTKILGAISCFDYQACEVAQWQSTEGYSYISALKDLCHRKIANQNRENVPWSVRELDDVRLDAYKGTAVRSLSQLVNHGS